MQLSFTSLLSKASVPMHQTLSIALSSQNYVAAISATQKPQHGEILSRLRYKSVTSSILE